MDIPLGAVSEFLNEIFEQRRFRNEKYSLRAFARDAGLSASHASEILQGRSGISGSKAIEVAANLKLSAFQKKRLLNLADSQFSRSKVLKKRASERQTVAQNGLMTVSHSTFSMISPWYHLAILEYLKLEGASHDPLAIASALAITPVEAKTAICNLEKHGFLQSNNKGRLELLRPSNSTANDTPSAAIRIFHKQVIDKAVQCLDSLPPTQRDFQTLVFAGEAERIAEIKQDIMAFVEAMDLKYSNESRPDSVYSLTIQLAPLTRNPE
jgi:uncharacterized protein (TIGR02147 family)